MSEQKSVFISYRRSASQHLARSIYQDLRADGWDVFFDVNTADNGDLDRIILSQIGARTHFLLIISPDALARCVNAGDWVLREIQEAVRLGRNIVPIYEESAKFEREIGFLPADLREVIRNKSALRLPHDFFDEGMLRLRTRFLKPPSYDVPIVQPPAPERAEAARRMANAAETVDAGRAAPGQRGGVSAPTAASLARARAFRGTRNTDWTPYITTFPDSPLPDMPFCLVPAGTFTMGSSDLSNAQPHTQTFEQPYWIAQYPVTNAQWMAAVRAGAVREPKDIHALKWYKDAKMADAPVVGVTWYMARDFAAWAGCRLPTEREWEYAGRGVESWTYPWGKSWQPDRAWYYENSGGQPQGVTTKPEGASWVGALHLSGNVWEWTSSLYRPYPYNPADGREDADNRIEGRVLRGGAWIINSDILRASDRYYWTPDDRYHYLGFRCARS